MTINATYTVEIGWSTNITGGFVVGTSTVGSTSDRIGSFTISGWTDETSNVKMATITRGSSQDLGQVIAGSCTIVLYDPNGRYNPTNTSSALYPNVVPMRPVRIKATYSGTDYYRFFGYIQTISTSPTRERQEAVISCTDLYAWLSVSYPVVSANGATTTTGAAITRILQLSGFNDPAMFDIDTGDTIADYSADGTQSALSQIQGLISAEGGTFYISRAGLATFENRYARYQAPRTSDQSTIAGTMDTLDGVTDVSTIKNIARYTRTGGTQQTYSDNTSIQKYGKRTITKSSGYWLNDAQALSAATFYIALNKNPRAPVQISITGNSSDTLMTALLARDLNDRIGISESRGGTSGSFFLESISETIALKTLHSAEMYLSALPASVPANY